jgi:hypothetical protein
MKMRRTKLGQYQFGSRQVLLFVRSGTGGDFVSFGDSGMAEISVGIDDDWMTVLASLIHEAIEFACVDKDKRFRPDQDYSSATDAYWFIFNHRDFSEIIARATTFLTGAIPDLVHKYKKVKR